MKTKLGARFRGFLPVIIDVETGGVDPKHDALLELAAITVSMDEAGMLLIDRTYHYHIEPFVGANLDPASLAFNKIDPYHPFRFAISEKEVLKALFSEISSECKTKGCSRAVVVAHNAWFDHHFLNAAIQRTKMTKHPFHRFTSFDTATLAGLAFGQTVLSKALSAAKIPFNAEEAHSALYDASATAKLFCEIVNRWQLLSGEMFPLQLPVEPEEETGQDL